jgi:LytS/YehU family sensor histidine kinase
MEAIQLYVDLEQLRFQCKFTYTTRVDQVLLDGDYRVLSLLIQPYVENAIVHGIAHSERKDLQLKVSAYLEKEYIHYVIEDNGVGRRQAEEYNRVNKPHHKSVGLQISEDRMHIFNQQKEAHGEIRVTDLHDAGGRASGTRIDISIKAI